MARKSALQKIESHEKLCRIMQKQTFEQIKEMKDRIKRLEYWIVGGMGAVLITYSPTSHDDNNWLWYRNVYLWYDMHTHRCYNCLLHNK